MCRHPDEVFCIQAVGSMLLISFLYNFKAVSYSNGIREQAAEWGFLYFMKEPTKIVALPAWALARRWALQKRKMDTLMSSGQLNWNLLIGRCCCRGHCLYYGLKATLEHVRRLQLKNTLGKTSRFAQVYDESRLNVLKIEVLQHSMWFSTKSHKCTIAGDKLQNWDLYATSLFKLQIGLNSSRTTSQADKHGEQVSLQNINWQNRWAPMMSLANKREKHLLGHPRKHNKSR